MEKTAAKTHLLGKALYFAVLPFWHIRPMAPLRVRAVIVNERNQILMVKNWFGPGTWELPGGAVEAGETARQAIVRELQEELGITVARNNIEFAGLITYKKPLAQYKASCFLIRSSHTKFRLTGEVYAVEWQTLSFAKEHLPHFAHLFTN